MTDSEIYNQRVNNMNFRQKLRNVISLNQEVMDENDNNMVRPILDEETYKHSIKEKSMKEQWNMLGKEIKTINNNRYELPSSNSRENSPIPAKEEIRNRHTSETHKQYTRIPTVPSTSNKSMPSTIKLEEEIRQLQITIQSLTTQLNEKDIERKDIIDDFQAKEVRIMKSRQEEIKKITKRYESKILSIQRDNELRIEQLTTERDHLTKEITNVKQENQIQCDKLKRVVESLSSENEHLRFENKRLASKDEQVNSEQIRFNQSLMIENKELKQTIENMKRQNGIVYDVVQDDSDDDVDEEIENVPRNEFKYYATKPEQQQYSGPIMDSWLPNTPKTSLPDLPLENSHDTYSTERLMNEIWNSVVRDRNQVDQIIREP